MLAYLEPGPWEPMTPLPLQATHHEQAYLTPKNSFVERPRMWAELVS